MLNLALMPTYVFALTSGVLLVLINDVLLLKSVVVHPQIPAVAHQPQHCA
jgi:hypothetical protein